MTYKMATNKFSGGGEIRNVGMGGGERVPHRFLKLGPCPTAKLAAMQKITFSGCVLTFDPTAITTNDMKLFRIFSTATKKLQFSVSFVFLDKNRVRFGLAHVE